MVLAEPDGLEQEKVIESVIFKVAESWGTCCSELGTNMCYQFYSKFKRMELSFSKCLIFLPSHHQLNDALAPTIITTGKFLLIEQKKICTGCDWYIFHSNYFLEIKIKLQQRDLLCISYVTLQEEECCGQGIKGFIMCLFECPHCTKGLDICIPFT